jgi:hypothetical protein
MSCHEDPHDCLRCHGQEHHHQHPSHPSGPGWQGCGCEAHHRRDDCCCHSHGRDSDDGHGGHGDGPGRGRHGGGGPGGRGRNPNRPTRVTGTSRGRLPSDAGLTPGDIRDPHPADSWAGQRQDLFLPYLFHRAHAGDTGARPVIGPFWESPDIHVAPGIAPADAPPVPPELGSVAVAGAPNTVYAHVWNFGQSAAPQTVVEFYWCDPAFGIGPQSANLIGQKVVSLGARGSGQAHKLVKCPEAWTPRYITSAHECLVVRAWDYTSDTLGTAPWDASLNRHVAQRNIHLIDTAHPTLLPDLMQLGARAELATPAQPAVPVLLLLKVGPTFGAPATLNVERVTPTAMPWLQLRTGRGKFPTQAFPDGTVALSRPGLIGGGVPTGGAASQQHVTGDDAQVAFTTTDTPPAAGEAHVYRISASQGDQLLGGYTIVLLGR